MIENVVLFAVGAVIKKVVETGMKLRQTQSSSTGKNLQTIYLG